MAYFAKYADGQALPRHEFHHAQTVRGQLQGRLRALRLHTDDAPQEWW